MIPGRMRTRTKRLFRALGYFLLALVIGLLLFRLACPKPGDPGHPVPAIVVAVGLAALLRWKASR